LTERLRSVREYERKRKATVTKLQRLDGVYRRAAESHAKKVGRSFFFLLC
jgi:hypothetical protein